MIERELDMKQCVQNRKKNNQGFSLVEMIVAFAILGIAIIAIGGFVITGVRSYAKTNKDAQVQNEAQLALNRIEDTVVDAALGVSYRVRTEDAEDLFVEKDADVTGTPAEKYLYVFNWDNERVSVVALLIRYDAEEKKLYYCDYGVVGNGTDTEISEAMDIDAGSNSWDLLAENVEAFSADLSDYDSNHKVYVDLTKGRAQQLYNARHHHDP